MSTIRRMAIGIAVALTVAACGGGTAAVSSTVAGSSASGAAGPTTAASQAASAPAASAGSAAPTAAPASAAPAASAAPGSSVSTISLPVSTLKGTLDKTEPGFDPNKLYGLKPGSIQFSWFRGSGGTMVVIYFGIVGMQTQAPACAATSIKTGSGIEHLTTSSFGVGGCAGDDKYLATPPAGAQICNGGFLVYVSTIPNDAVGTLVASLEKAQPDGSVTGLTSATETDTPQANEGQFDISKYSCVPAA